MTYESNLTTWESLKAAIRYLDKKQEERDNRMELALIPWVVGAFAVNAIVFALFEVWR